MGSRSHIVCPCGNSDPVKFRRYMSDDAEVLGAFCVFCESEWLQHEFIVGGEGKEPDVTMKMGPHRLIRRETPKLSQGASVQVQPAKTEIKNFDHLEGLLKRGDHIAWHRPYVIWHHAIVLEVNGTEVTVIEYPGKSGIRTFKRSVKEEWGGLYRIDYPKDVRKANPSDLVIARARSRLGEQEYTLLGKNCEAFATFCKVGRNKSQQVDWFEGKVVQTVITALGKMTKDAARLLYKYYLYYGTVEGTNIGSSMGDKVCKVLGPTIVIATEFGFMVYDLKEIHKHLKAGDMTMKTFVVEAVQRVTEALMSVGLVLGMSKFGEIAGGCVGTMICPGIGTAIGMIVGGVIGGAIGGAIGKLSGSAIGHTFGELIVKYIKRDNEAVQQVGDLKPGDQIVLPGCFLHPRHHAIVVKIDIDKDQIVVIHNTWSQGVVKERVAFASPLYRVVWAPGEAEPDKEVLRKARSKIGKWTPYNLCTNNCMHFAKWCKEKRKAE